MTLFNKESRILKMKKEIDFEEFASVLAEEEVFRVIDRLSAEASKLGAESYTHEILLQFLARFVGITVYQVLEGTARANVGKKNRAKQVIDNLAIFKSGMQDAISAGYQSAMGTFSGKDIDYYCKISPVPEAKNKLHC